MTSVAEATWNEVAGLDPNSTAVAAPILKPMIETAVPPLIGPTAGVSSPITGVGGFV